MASTGTDRGLYGQIEDSYYGFCDFLQQQLKLPVYDWFITPIESRGVPSLPIFLLLLLGIAVGAYFALGIFFQGTTSLGITVLQNGDPLSGVLVILEIDGNEFGSIESDDEGRAVFEKVPVGKSARVVAEQPGLQKFEKEFIVSKETPEITAALQSGGASISQKVKVTIKVADASGVPLGGASVSYFDSENGLYDQAVTDASGLALLTAANLDSELSVTIEKSNYVASQVRLVVSVEKSKQVTLSKKSQVPVDEGGEVAPLKGEVLVSIKDTDGNPVDATVSLFLAGNDELLDSGRTYLSGKVLFTDIDAVGQRVYVVANPIDEAYLPLDDSEGSQILLSGTALEFQLQLEEKDVGRDYGVTITVKEVGGSNLEAAAVRMYNQETNALLASNTTDGQGQTTFTTDKIVYISAYKDGYLPNLLLDGQMGESYSIELENARDDNSARIKVTVLDSDGELTQAAKVNIFTEDGFFLGLKDQLTIEDGTTAFSNVPTLLFGGQAKYYVTASKDCVSGASSSFIPEVGDANEVVVKLARPMGTLIVSLRDATNQKTIPAGGAKAFLRSDGLAIPDGECAFSSGSCSIKVPANKQVYLKISSQNYLEYETEDLFVEPQSEKKIEVKLIPAALKNELSVNFEGLASTEGGTYARDFPSLSKGSYYYAKFVLNIPAGSEMGGMFIRVGGSDSKTAEEDIAAISYYDKPANSAVTKGFSYNPSQSCKSDKSSDVDGSAKMAKWVQYEFPKQQNTKAVVLKIFIKPTAKQNDEISINYRGYASSGSIFTRVPEDAALGTAERTDEWDSCYAESDAVSFRISEDRFICNDKACLSLQFGEANLPRVSKGFAVDVGVPFKAYFSLRALKRYENSPFLKLTDDSELSFGAFRLGSSSGNAEGRKEWTWQLESLEEGSTISGEIELLGLLSTAYSRMELIFGDADSQYISLKSSVQVTGTNDFLMQVAPLQMQANDDSSLRVLLQNALDESAITDATITIEEDESAAFDGMVPDSIVGDGSEKEGADGVYEFRRLHPLNTGRFTVIAKREGFRNAKKEVAVSLTEFLSASSQSILLSCDGSTLDVENLLNAEINVLAQSNCITLIGDGVNTIASGTGAAFTLGAKKKKSLVLTPTRQGSACDLSIDGEAAGGSHANIKIPVKINCALPKFCTLDSQCDAGMACVENICKKIELTPTATPYGALPTDTLTLELDEALQFNGYYSLQEITRGSTITGCTIRSPETDENAKMENYVNLDCSTDPSVLVVLADYSGHPYYKGVIYADLDNLNFGGKEASSLSFSGPELRTLSFAADPSSRCGDANVETIYSCTDGGYVVVSKTASTGKTYYKSDGTVRQRCPEVGTLAQKEACEQLEETLGCTVDACTPETEAATSTDATLDTNKRAVVQTGRLYITFSNKPQLSVRVVITGPAVKPGASQTTDTNGTIVVITSYGFEPPAVSIPENAKVTWVNQDSKAHQLQSISGYKSPSGVPFKSGSIQPGKTYSFQFTRSGIYNYRDMGENSMKGIVYVGNVDAICKYKNNNYFAQRFVGHLTKGLIGQLEPQAGKSKQVAYSSFYKFYVYTNGIQAVKSPGLAQPAVYGQNFNGFTNSWNPAASQNMQYYQQNQLQMGPYSSLQTADDPGICEVVGNGAGFSCKVHLSPFLPINGAAFSIINDYALAYGSASNIQLYDTGEELKYLAGYYADKNGPDGKIIGALQDLNSIIGIAPRYTTFIFTNDPRKMKYEFSGEAGSTEGRLLFDDGKETKKQRIVMKFVPTGQEFSIEFEFIIHNEGIGKYVLQSVPVSSQITARNDEGTDAVEPFYLVNNIPGSKLVDVPDNGDLCNQANPNKLCRGNDDFYKLYYFEQNLKLGTERTFDLRRIRDEDPFPLALPSPTTLDSDGAYDVIGNPGSEGDGGLQCSGNNFCSEKDLQEAAEEVAKDIEEAHEDIRIQKLDFAGFGDYALERIAEAAALTLQDYIADKAQYELCKGVEALTDGFCKQSVSSSYDYNCVEGAYCDQTVTGSELWAVEKDMLDASVCDSEFLNTFEALAATNNFGAIKQAMMNRMMQKGFPFQPRVQYAKPIVDTRGLEVSVLFKTDASAKTAGYVLKSFSALTEEQGSSSSGGFFTLDQALSSESVDAGLQKALSKNKNEVSEKLKPQPKDRFIAVSLDNSNNAPIYHYLENPVIVKQDAPGLPTLYTMNKYAFSTDLTQDKLKIYDESFGALKGTGGNRDIKIKSCNIGLKQPPDWLDDRGLLLDYTGIENSCADMGIKLDKVNDFNMLEPFSFVMLDPANKELTFVSVKTFSACDVQIPFVMATPENCKIKDTVSSADFSDISEEAFKAALKYLLREGAQFDLTHDGKPVGMWDISKYQDDAYWLFTFKPDEYGVKNQPKNQSTEIFGASMEGTALAEEAIQRISLTPVSTENTDKCLPVDKGSEEDEFTATKDKVCVNAQLDLSKLPPGTKARVCDNKDCTGTKSEPEDIGDKETELFIQRKLFEGKNICLALEKPDGTIFSSRCWLDEGKLVEKPAAADDTFVAIKPLPESAVKVAVSNERNWCPSYDSPKTSPSPTPMAEYVPPIDATDQVMHMLYHYFLACKQARNLNGN